jgi:hypothetical protein
MILGGTQTFRQEGQVQTVDQRVAGKRWVSLSSLYDHNGFAMGQWNASYCRGYQLKSAVTRRSKEQ